jgi:sulfur transfer protein SufE
MNKAEQFVKSLVDEVSWHTALLNIIDLGDKVPLNPDIFTPENKITRCTSDSYAMPVIKECIVTLYHASNSRLMNGYLAVIAKLVEGRSVQVINKDTFKPLQKYHILQNMGEKQQQATAEVINRILNHCSQTAVKA